MLAFVTICSRLQSNTTRSSVSVALYDVTCLLTYVLALSDVDRAVYRMPF